jgi:Peptidase propeptide and YPEB domain
MLRVAVILTVLLLPGAALAQGGATSATVVPQHHDAAPPMERLSRAQARQMIADRGYFELRGLSHDKNGGWRCTATGGGGKRVIVTLDRNGNITQSEVPETSRQ